MIRSSFLALSTLAIASPVAARISETIVQTFGMRAEAAKFQGAILIGEKNGSSRTLVTSSDQVAPIALWRWASITKQLAAVEGKGFAYDVLSAIACRR